MKIFPNKFPSNIPYILAALTGGAFGAYFFTGLIAETKMGRPSSTSAIGFFFVPVYSIFIAGVSFIVGEIITKFTSKFIVERAISKKVNYLIYTAFLMTISVSSVSGWISFMKYEDSQRPHVIFNSGSIEKINGINFQEATNIEAKYLFTSFDDEKRSIEKIIWNHRPVHFELLEKENSLILLDDDKGTELVLVDLNGFDYITRAYAVPISLDESNASGLAVLVHLRATSHCSMLFIYDANATLLYQELLYRTDMDNVLKAVKDTSGKEYLLVTADKSISYSFIKVKT